MEKFTKKSFKTIQLYKTVRIPSEKLNKETREKARTLFRSELSAITEMFYFSRDAIEEIAAFALTRQLGDSHENEDRPL